MKQKELDESTVVLSQRQKENDVKQRWKGKLKRVITDNNEQMRYDFQKKSLLTKYNKNVYKKRKNRKDAQLKARKDQQQTSQAWERYKHEMKARIDERPLLMEREKIAVEQQQSQKKALLLVKKSLESAGITQYQTFFSDQELAILKNANVQLLAKQD
ncbi:hypothetical protein RFI_08185 [Reticulomyxa filosa]|uniref:Uncharacterized protein n=1 Tax=Reticulomyxa filosa TaxID=46433 RepID=X6NRN6_RETFI|nr:hypothetical protein RFI_08185 [Reticulomyxa filosa]|eukprot:ETO28940.1 hypothetical protein RFI_08185 [Reticulomyxa filosa]